MTEDGRGPAQPPLTHPKGIRGAGDFTSLVTPGKTDMDRW